MTDDRFDPAPVISRSLLRINILLATLREQERAAYAAGDKKTLALLTSVLTVIERVEDDLDRCDEELEYQREADAEMAL